MARKFNLCVGGALFLSAICLAWLAFQGAPQLASAGPSATSPPLGGSGEVATQVGPYAEPQPQVERIPSASVEFHVLSGERVPIAGAVIDVMQHDSRLLTRAEGGGHQAGNDGVVRMAWSAVAGKRVVASHPGYSAASIALPADPEGRYDIVIERGCRVRFEVHYVDGSPASGIDVMVSAAGPPALDGMEGMNIMPCGVSAVNVWQSRTDSDGRVDFDGLQLGSYAYLVEPFRYWVMEGPNAVFQVVGDLTIVHLRIGELYALIVPTEVLWHDIVWGGGLQGALGSPASQIPMHIATRYLATKFPGCAAYVAVKRGRAAAGHEQPSATLRGFASGAGWFETVVLPEPVPSAQPMRLEERHHELAAGQGELAVRVLSKDGVMLHHAKVTMRSLDEPSLEGRTLIVRQDRLKLPPGRYLITAGGLSKEVKVVAGSATDVSMQMDWICRDVTLSVRDGAGDRILYCMLDGLGATVGFHGGTYECVMEEGEHEVGVNAYRFERASLKIAVDGHSPDTIHTKVSLRWQN